MQEAIAKTGKENGVVSLHEMFARLYRASCLGDDRTVQHRSISGGPSGEKGNCSGGLTGVYLYTLIFIHGDLVFQKNQLPYITINNLKRINIHFVDFSSRAFYKEGNKERVHHECCKFFHPMSDGSLSGIGFVAGL